MGAGRPSAREAYSGFFRAEYQAVVRTVELMLGDHEAALDVAQEAFARLYRHWWRVSRYDVPAAWVRRVAVNLAISHLRRRKLQQKVLPALPFGAAPQPEADDAVLAAVRALPPAQRAAVVLFYFEDQPTSEVAALLGCSEATARVHLHRARTKLAAVLDPEEHRTRRSSDVTR
ncbi:MAG TPA: SigE family RNA polymerase sigma factor [Actinomycetota bacterium]|nr:SigE family RNA polymerase sigma factor [Actinomycetota bacterium]